MKRSISIILLVVGSMFLQQVHAQVACSNDSTGLIPITDLGTGYYLGHQGGLYPGGQNTIPGGHLSNGVKILKKMKPLDSLGNVDYANGKILLAGFGASTVGGPFNHMIQLLKDYDDLNPCFKAINTSNGAEGVESMNPDNDEYWEYIRTNRLLAKGYYPAQVQVGWFMHSSTIDSNGNYIDEYIDSLDKRFILALQTLLIEYPNLKAVFISGFPYGGYADSSRSLFPVIREPSSYHHNFAVKELITRQISGDPQLKYRGPTKKVPFICWGPPLWADGVNPRAYDGLSWDCETDFDPDGGGYHMTFAGKDKLANILIDFFRTDTLTKGWVMNGPKWSTCGTGRYADGSVIAAKPQVIQRDDFTIYPNPSSGLVYIDFDKDMDVAVNVQVLNSLGAVVYADKAEAGTMRTGFVLHLENLPQGMYHVQLFTNDQMFSQPVVLTK